MIAGILSNHFHRTQSSRFVSALLLSLRNNNVSPLANDKSIAQLPYACQQVRFAPKTIGLKYRYGLPPLYTDHKYLEAVEDENIMSDLAYEDIRFASLWETNSPLQDDVVEKYIRFMMTSEPRRELIYELMHKTFYEIKRIQYKRYLRSKREQEEKKSNTQNDKKKRVTSKENEDDQDNELEMNPVVLFHKAIDNCKPLVITQKIRRGGATYQVPFPISANQSEYLAMKWLDTTIKERPKPRKRHYYEELAQEVIDAASGRGKVVKKRDDIHKLAQANKAYSHYRWG